MPPTNATDTIKQAARNPKRARSLTPSALQTKPIDLTVDATPHDTITTNSPKPKKTRTKKVTSAVNTVVRKQKSRRKATNEKLTLYRQIRDDSDNPYRWLTTMTDGRMIYNLLTGYVQEQLKPIRKGKCVAKGGDTIAKSNRSTYTEDIENIIALLAAYGWSPIDQDTERLRTIRQNHQEWIQNITTTQIHDATSIRQHFRSFDFPTDFQTAAFFYRAQNADTQIPASPPQSSTLQTATGGDNTTQEETTPQNTQPTTSTEPTTETTAAPESSETEI